MDHLTRDHLPALSVPVSALRIGTMVDRNNDSGSRIRNVINQLQAPISDLPTLLTLLSGPLDCIGLLPPHYRQYNTVPLHPNAFNTSRHLPPLQRALLEHVIPNWELDLSREKLMPLVEQWFIPDTFSYATSAAGEVALQAYTSILSLPFTSYSMNLLARLTKTYPLDRLHASVFSHASRDTSSRQTHLAWEDVVKSVLSVPAKVANALEGVGEIPKELELGSYFAHLSLRCETLLWKLSQSQEHTEGASSFGCNKLTANKSQKVCDPSPIYLQNS